MSAVTALPCRTPRTYQVRVLTAGRCTFHGPVLLEPMPGGLMAVCSGRHSGVHLTEEEALRALFPDATYITTGSTLAHLMHTFADALRAYSDEPVATWTWPCCNPRCASSQRKWTRPRKIMASPLASRSNPHEHRQR